MVALNYMSTLGDGLLAVGGVDGYQFRDGLDIFIPSDGAGTGKSSARSKRRNVVRENVFVTKR
jgi:hypothetical protein